MGKKVKDFSLLNLWLGVKKIFFHDIPFFVFFSLKFSLLLKAEFLSFPVKRTK